MPSEATNESTRREWRKLGFYYDLDHETKEWKLIGSKAGIAGFAAQIREFASDPHTMARIDHEHLGPYWYLEIGVWHEPQITDHRLAGSSAEMMGLAENIERKLAESSAGDVLLLRSMFAPDSPYELRLEVRDDTFDPATADPACW